MHRLRAAAKCASRASKLQGVHNTGHSHNASPAWCTVRSIRCATHGIQLLSQGQMGCNKTDPLPPAQTHITRLNAVASRPAPAPPHSRALRNPTTLHGDAAWRASHPQLRASLLLGFQVSLCRTTWSVSTLQPAPYERGTRGKPTPRV